LTAFVGTKAEIEGEKGKNCHRGDRGGSPRPLASRCRFIKRLSFKRRAICDLIHEAVHKSLPAV
jgi:hypothetical protein